ncbi:MAG: hypothetical protein G01um101470_745 [Parcubacteria group bacterium Gr01-1014_70]|nr:MAG: hypothetical protein G01um101470_745 [Parcubacteria group bacterium Gr01-1014_70]
MTQRLIVICGLPLTGKSTNAQLLSKQLNIHHVDIDANVRNPLFGLPDPNPYKSAESEAMLRKEMGECYDLLIHATRSNLSLGRSVIITATFSSLRSRENLTRILHEYPSLSLHTIVCGTKREGVEENEIKRRLATRVFGKDYFGGCNSVEHYMADKKRYAPWTDELPYLELDTFPPYTITDCLERAFLYINFP